MCITLHTLLILGVSANLIQWFLIGEEANFPPTGHWQHLETFLVIVLENAVGMKWVGARAAAKHPLMHRVVFPMAKNFLTQNVKSSKVENP